MAASIVIILPIISGLIASILLAPNIQYVASDDALFYLQIAYDQLSSGNTSFNGVESTNGFHPLQMIALLLLKLLTPGISRESFLVVGLIFGTLCNIGTIFFLTGVIRHLGGGLLTCLGSASAFGFYIFGGMFFSEAAISALCISALLYYLVRAAKINVVKLGLLSGVMVLARLDNAFILPFLFLYLLFTKRLLFSQCFIAGIVSIAVTLPYLTWNYISFGALMPVSGWAKGTFPEIRDLGKAWYDCTPLSKLTVVGLLVSLFIQRRFTVLQCFVCGALASWTYYLLFQHASSHSWYFVLGILIIVIVIPLEVEQLLPQKLYGFTAVALSCVLLLALPAYTTFKGMTKGTGNINELIRGRTWGKIIFHDVGTKAGNLLPEGTRVLTFDLPGYLAYFGNISVFPIDCLTLNVSACNELHSDPEAFMKSRKITHALWRFPEGCKQELPLHKYYTWEPIGSISIDCNNAQLVDEHFQIYSVPIL